MTTETLPQPNDPVREPIINSPFETPQWRWQLDTSTKAYAPALPGRRESQNIPPVAGSRKLRSTQALPGEMGARWIPLKLVNDIRMTVLGWQQDGYPGITQTSRDLINHWTDEEACQLYFAQLDAMLTHIYLNEATTDQIREEIQGINDRYNDGIFRIAHKMATATGETPTRGTHCPRIPSGSRESGRYEIPDFCSTSSTCPPHQSSWHNPTPGHLTG